MNSIFNIYSYFVIRNHSFFLIYPILNDFFDFFSVLSMTTAPFVWFRSKLWSASWRSAKSNKNDDSSRLQKSQNSDNPKTDIPITKMAISQKKVKTEFRKKPKHRRESDPTICGCSTDRKCPTPSCPNIGTSRFLPNPIWDSTRGQLQPSSFTSQVRFPLSLFFSLFSNISENVPNSKLK